MVSCHFSGNVLHQTCFPRGDRAKRTVVIDFRELSGIQGEVTREEATATLKGSL